MEILDLFIVALMPVLKTLLITAVGLLLAIDRIGLLGPDARHHLNNVSFMTRAQLHMHIYIYIHVRIIK